jgi:hypothetical protein
MLKVAKNAAWVAAFAVLVVFVLGMAATGSLKHPPPDSQPKPKAGSPDTANRVWRKTPIKRGANDRRKSSGTIHSGSARLIGFSFFLMVLVGATVAVFISGEKVAESAKTSAKAAQQSADVAEKALRLTQRAYVIIHRINSTGGNDERGKLMGYLISVTWKNTGSSPALDFGSVILSTIVDTRPEGCSRKH